LLVFRAPGVTLPIAHRRAAWVTMLAGFERAGEGLDLLGRVVRQRAGTSFPSLVGSFGRISREVEGPLAGAS
jgi:hypothetical protein